MSVRTLPWSEGQGTCPILAFLGVAVDIALNKHTFNVCEQTKNNKARNNHRMEKGKEEGSVAYDITACQHKIF